AAARAQQEQAQLDALLAPVALYPDDVVRLVLDAATAPAEVADAAQWSRNNQGMTAEDSVRAVQAYPWRPSVKALVAYPELVQRMAESPQWTSDLGNAWLSQQAQVMATIQALRQRAQASGALQSNEYQTVQPTDQGIAVVPTMPYVYYVPYYDPLVVYGGWWWPAYRPVFWRPWYARPVFVTQVAVVNRGFRTGPHAFPHFVPHGVPSRAVASSPAVRMQQQQSRQFVARQQMQSRPSPAVQMQNRGRMPGNSFHPTMQRPPMPPHVQPYVQSHGTPYVQSHGGPYVQSHAGPARFSPAVSSSGGRPSSGGYHGGGGHGGGRGRG
ncbi:MAG TPA: DUF3300 domain-containing protein, partial [Burkholderiales bacterium]|nr:DUF3300 domain-containing protein [Burkholderiales bacterium]